MSAIGRKGVGVGAVVDEDKARESMFLRAGNLPNELIEPVVLNLAIFRLYPKPDEREEGITFEQVSKFQIYAFKIFKIVAKTQQGSITAALERYNGGEGSCLLSKMGAILIESSRLGKEDAASKGSKKSGITLPEEDVEEATCAVEVVDYASFLELNATALNVFLTDQIWPRLMEWFLKINDGSEGSPVKFFFLRVSLKATDMFEECQNLMCGTIGKLYFEDQADEDNMLQLQCVRSRMAEIAKKIDCFFASMRFEYSFFEQDPEIQKIIREDLSRIDSEHFHLKGIKSLKRRGKDVSIKNFYDELTAPIFRKIGFLAKTPIEVLIDFANKTYRRQFEFFSKIQVIMNTFRDLIIVQDNLFEVIENQVEVKLLQNRVALEAAKRVTEKSEVVALSCEGERKEEEVVKEVETRKRAPRPLTLQFILEQLVCESSARCPAYLNAIHRLEDLMYQILHPSSPRVLECFTSVVGITQVMEQLLVAIARRQTRDESIKGHNLLMLLKNIPTIKAGSLEYKMIYDLNDVEFKSRNMLDVPKFIERLPPFILLKRSYVAFLSGSHEGVEDLHKDVLEFIKKYLIFISKLQREFLGSKLPQLEGESIDRLFLRVPPVLEVRGGGASAAAVDDDDLFGPIQEVLREDETVGPEKENLYFYLALLKAERSRDLPELQHFKISRGYNLCYLFLEAVCRYKYPVVSGSSAEGSIRRHNFFELLREKWDAFSEEEQEFLLNSSNVRYHARYEEDRSSDSSFATARKVVDRAVAGGARRAGAGGPTTVKLKGDEGIAWTGKMALAVSDFDQMYRVMVGLAVKILEGES